MRRCIIPRIVKEYDERYAEFLDVAQQFFFTKGYEQTSVQEIITTIGVAKGTFYHYFSSKADILDALVKRMFEQTLQSLETMLADTSLNAVQKLKQFFSETNLWKVSNKDMLLNTVRVLYTDENVLLREKMREEASRSIVPVLGQIIRQGVDEKVFDVAYPDQAAELIINMPRVISETIVGMLLIGKGDDKAIQQVRQQVHVFNQSVARVLGMVDESLVLIDDDILDIWL